MSFIDLAKSRYSVRKFDQRPVEAYKIERLIEAGRVAPTAKNLQPQKLYVVRSKEGIDKLNRLSPCIYGATTVLMIGYDVDLMWRHPDHEEVNSGTVDASIVLTHIMLAAEEEGLGTCWVARFDPYETAAEFNIEDKIRLVALMPVGYPAVDADPSAFHEKYRNDDEWIIME